MYIDHKNGKFTLYLNKNIGEDTILLDLERIFKENMSVKSIEIMIDSLGGSVDSAFMIVDFLNEIQKKGVTVETVVTGRAYSAASLIASAGTKGHRYLGANAGVMIHTASFPSNFDKSAISEDEQKALTEMANISFAKKLNELTGVEYEVFKNIIDTKKDYYFTDLIELQQLGIIDKEVLYLTAEKVEEIKMVAQKELNIQKTKIMEIEKLQADLLLAHQKQSVMETQIQELQSQIIGLQNEKKENLQKASEFLVAEFSIDDKNKDLLEMQQDVFSLIKLSAVLGKKQEQKKIEQVDFQASASAKANQQEAPLRELLEKGEKIEKYQEKFAKLPTDEQIYIFNNLRTQHINNF
jgi:ATP-dependent Clp protease protease subunit